MTSTCRPRNASRGRLLREGWLQDASSHPCRAEEMTPTSMSLRCTPTSVEGGHDVDGRHAPQSDQIAGNLKAFKKKGLDRKTNHQDLTKAETKKLAQRPPLWRNKLRLEGESVDADEKNTDGNKGPDEVFDRGESMFWLAPLDVEHEGTI